MTTVTARTPAYRYTAASLPSAVVGKSPSPTRSASWPSLGQIPRRAAVGLGHRHPIRGTSGRDAGLSGRKQLRSVGSKRRSDRVPGQLHDQRRRYHRRHSDRLRSLPRVDQGDEGKRSDGQLRRILSPRSPKPPRSSSVRSTTFSSAALRSWDRTRMTSSPARSEESSSRPGWRRLYRHRPGINHRQGR